MDVSCHTLNVLIGKLSSALHSGANYILQGQLHDIQHMSQHNELVNQGFILDHITAAYNNVTFFFLKSVCINPLLFCIW